MSRKKERGNHGKLWKPESCLTGKPTAFLRETSISIFFLSTCFSTILWGAVMQTIPIQKLCQGNALCSLQLRSHLTYLPHLRRGKLPNIVSAWLFSREAGRRNECYCCLVLAGCSCSLNKMRESHKYWQSSVLPFSRSWTSKQRWVCQLSSQMSVPFRSRFGVFLPTRRNITTVW